MGHYETLPRDCKNWYILGFTCEDQAGEVENYGNGDDPDAFRAVSRGAHNVAGIELYSLLEQPPETSRLESAWETSSSGAAFRHIIKISRRGEGSNPFFERKSDRPDLLKKAVLTKKEQEFLKKLSEE